MNSAVAGAIRAIAAINAAKRIQAAVTALLLMSGAGFPPASSNRVEASPEVRLRYPVPKKADLSMSDLSILSSAKR